MLQGRQFLIHLIQNSRSNAPSSLKPQAPINVYVCTRRPPPAKEPDLFVLRQSSSASDWFSTIAPQDDVSTSDDNILDRIKLHHLPLDLASPSSIRACAKSFLEKESKLDFLLLNAAVAPKSRKVTHVKLKGEPVEEAMMTNVLGHALLTESLKSAFHERGSERSTRVVTVSSELHRRVQEIGKSFPLRGLAHKQRMN
jgi:NAD(P)-dependent dehydrogenase (short-subunit alcohol dehydrogenase family)